MNTQRAVNTIQRYHERVQTALKRKRGNPPDVLKALTFLRGGRFCEVCGVTEYEKRIELHHKDGNWKNYQINNLGFYCSDCHLNDHNGNWSNVPNQTEVVMSQVVTKYRWEGPTTTILFNKIKEYTDQGYCVREACREISKDSVSLFNQQFTWQALANTYYRRLRILTGQSNDRTTAPKVTSNKNMTTGVVMNRNDAIEFWRDMKRWGITVTN